MAFFPTFLYFSLTCVRCLYLGAGRDLSVKETVVLSKRKAAEGSYLSTRFSGKNKIKLLLYLHILEIVHYNIVPFY